MFVILIIVIVQGGVAVILTSGVLVLPLVSVVAIVIRGLSSDCSSTSFSSNNHSFNV